MRVTSKTGLIRPFNLIRWFSLTALASVAIVSALAAWSFSAFLTERMIRQEAEITAGFVRRIVAREDAYFHSSHPAWAPSNRRGFSSTT